MIYLPRERYSSPFLGGFTLQFDAYNGEDFSKKCFLFPGQGVSLPKMFNGEYKRILEFQKYFEITDRHCALKKLPKASLRKLLM